MTPRSCLRWKPTGKIFKTVGLRWVPTGKIFTYSTTNVDSEPKMVQMTISRTSMNVNQTLDVSAGTLNIHAGTSLNPTKEGLRVWLLKRLISEKPGYLHSYNHRGNNMQIDLVRYSKRKISKRKISKRKISKRQPWENEFKSFSWQRLSENICQLILCPHKIQLYHSFFHLFSDEMMSDVDVFRPGVLNVVAAKSYGTLVVTVQRDAIVSKAII
ncbi:hypothetical protein Tco_1482141 [Tanacetum coccineum]